MQIKLHTASDTELAGAVALVEFDEVEGLTAWDAMRLLEGYAVATGRRIVSLTGCFSLSELESEARSRCD